MARSKILVVLIGVIIMIGMLFFNHTYQEAKYDMYHIYTIALDSAMNIEPVLNHDYVEGRKFKSELRAAGFKATISYSGINKWELKKNVITWISEGLSKE